MTQITIKDYDYGFGVARVGIVVKHLHFQGYLQKHDGASNVCEKK